MFRVLNGLTFQLEGSTYQDYVDQLFKLLELTPDTHYLKIIDPETANPVSQVNQEKEYFVLAQPYFLDWIDSSKLTFGFSMNPNPVVVEYMKTHPKVINWLKIGSNPVATDFVLTQPRCRIDSTEDFSLNTHPRAIEEIERVLVTGHYRYIDMHNLSRNPSAVHLYEKYPENFSRYWGVIRKFNPSPAVIPMLIRKWMEGALSLNKSWIRSFENPEAIPVMEQFPEIRPWDSIQRNPHPTAFEWIKQRADEVTLDISGNPNPEILRWALDHTSFKQRLLSCVYLTETESFYRNTNILSFLHEYPELTATREQLNCLFVNTHPDTLIYAEKAYEQGKIQVAYPGGNVNLSKNPVMPPLLEKHPELINWVALSNNPGIFN